MKKNFFAVMFAVVLIIFLIAAVTFSPTISAADSGVVTGTIETVDLANSSLQIKLSVGPANEEKFEYQTFFIHDTVPVSKNGETLERADLTPGQTVRIAFDVDPNMPYAVAVSVTIIDLEKE